MLYALFACKAFVSAKNILIEDTVDRYIIGDSNTI